MIDLPALALSLTQQGLIDKAFYDMNRDEVEAMCEAVLAAHTPEHEIIPYILHDRSEPALVVPSNASPRFRRIGLIGDDARKVLRDTLKMLGADDDMMRRYLGKNWKEDMNV